MRPEVRVASIHLAKMKKEAAFMDGLQELSVKAIASDLSYKAEEESKKSTSRESRSGLFWAMKSEGETPESLVKKALGSSGKVDKDDPLTKMVLGALKKKRGTLEKIKLVGEFSHYYSKKDIKGMADVLGEEVEVVGLVMLWYAKESKTASFKEAAKNKKKRKKNRQKRRNRRSPSSGGSAPPSSTRRDTPPSSTRREAPPSSTRRDAPPSSTRREAPPSSSTRREAPPQNAPTNSGKPKRPKKVKNLSEGDRIYKGIMTNIPVDAEYYANIPKRFLSRVAMLTGGNALEWLVKFLPKGELVAKPLKWTYWAFLIKNYWSVGSFVAKWAGVALDLLFMLIDKVPYLGWIVSGIGKAAKWIVYSLLGGKGVITLTAILISLGILNKVKTRYVDAFNKLSLKQNAKVGFFAIWNAIKAFFNGTLRVSRVIGREIIDYIKDNSTMFNILVKKNNIDFDGVRELEDIVEA